MTKNATTRKRMKTVFGKTDPAEVPRSVQKRKKRCSDSRRTARQTKADDVQQQRWRQTGRPRAASMARRRMRRWWQTEGGMVAAVPPSSSKRSHTRRSPTPLRYSRHRRLVTGLLSVPLALGFAADLREMRAGSGWHHSITWANGAPKARLFRGKHEENRGSSQPPRGAFGRVANFPSCFVAYRVAQVCREGRGRPLASVS